MSWSDHELDALTKTFLTGVGHAADSLSRLVNKPVRLSSPALRLVPFTSLSSVSAFTLHQPMCTVYQHFDGGLRADALLLFPEQNSLELIQRLMDETSPSEKIAGFEREALTEVGNVLLNACMAALAESSNMTLKSTLPRCVSGDWMNGLRTEGKDEYEGLLLTVNISVENHKQHAYFLLAMGGESMERLKQRLDTHLPRPDENH